MAGMTLQQANEIEAVVRSAADVTIDLVQTAYRFVDIDVNGVTLRCKADAGASEMHVSGPFLVSFTMPVPQWYTDALAGGDFESDASRRSWQRDSARRAIEARAERNPEGIDAAAADRF